MQCVWVSGRMGDMVSRGNGSIDGGKPAAYKIQRRERPAGDWQDVSIAMDSETTLVDQPRGKELEYRAVAVNKAGDGEPSNTVLAVL